MPTTQLTSRLSAALPIRSAVPRGLAPGSTLFQLTGAATLAIGALLCGAGTAQAATINPPANDGSRWALSHNGGAVAPAWSNQAAWRDQANEFTQTQQFAAGSAAAPSICLGSNHGLYRVSSTAWGASVAGVSALQLSTTQIDSALPVSVLGNVTIRAAATQDAIAISGSGSGSSGYAVTLTSLGLSNNRTIHLQNASYTVAGVNIAQTWVAAQTFRAANAIRSEAAATQDAIVLAGRAGGTSSYAVTLTPPALAGNISVTLPTVTGSLACFDVAQTWSATQTIRAALGFRVEAAATQDAIVIAGRAGGTGSYAVSFIPLTLSANRTISVQNANHVLAGIDIGQTWTQTQVMNAALALNLTNTTDGTLTVAGRITAKAAVPASFADFAAVRTYLASILT